MSVDLPEPEGRQMMTTSPRATETEQSFSTAKLPYDLQTCLRLMMVLSVVMGLYVVCSIGMLETGYDLSVIRDGLRVDPPLCFISQAASVVPTMKAHSRS